MTDCYGALWLLAEEEAKPPPDPWMPLLIPLLVIGFLWYFLLLRPQRREQRRREEMLNSLKKNEKVVTIGGIIGTIVNVSPDGRDVTLRVDENTRLRMLRSSIQGPYKDSAEPDPAPKTS